MGVDIKDTAYQVRLIALMVKTPSFVGEYGRAIKPEWFDNKELQNITTAILQYYRQYHTSPTYTDLRIYLERFVTKDKKVKKEYARYLKLIRQAGKDGEMAFVHDHFKDFVEYSAMRQATLASAKALQDGKWKIIPDLMREARNATAESIEALDYFDDGMLKRLETKIVRRTIPIGIEEVDSILGGGLARNELSVVIAPTGTGKSIMLTNIGAHAVLKSLQAVHLFTEEDMSHVTNRYDCRMLHANTNTVKRNVGKAFKTLKVIHERGGGLNIANCMGWDISTLRSYLFDLDEKPDVVCLDYADKLAPPSRYRERRFELEAIYNELILIAKDLDCQMTTASQTKAVAKKEKLLNPEDIGEAYFKAQLASNILALCQTTDERKNGDIRIYIAKSRHNRSQVEIECKIMYPHMWITTRDEWLKRQGTGI